MNAGNSVSGNSGNVILDARFRFRADALIAGYRSAIRANGH